MKKLLTTCILFLALPVFSGELRGIDTGLVYESNSDYETAGVHFSVIEDRMSDDALGYLSLAVVQRLSKQDTDRAKNGTLSLEGGLGKEVEIIDNVSSGLGFLVRYDFEDLLTDQERLNGKDVYNRKGIKPGVFFMTNFGNGFDGVTLKVTATHNGYDTEVGVNLNIEIQD